MPTSALEQRLEHLLGHQNPDGGWGYYPSKESWTEPTVYAALALSHLHRDAARRAFDQLRARQLPMGAWSASSRVPEAHWSTALVLLLHQALGVTDAAYDRGLAWLLSTTGNDTNAFDRLLRMFGRQQLVEQNVDLPGWPWRPGNASWVEPTALSVLCLKRSSRKDAPAQARIDAGVKLLLDRRCDDGGWNYGNRRVYRVPLESYPETTGLALLALQGRGDLGKSVERARAYLKSAPRGMARAWLQIALACLENGSCGPLDGQLPAGGDIVVTALETIGAQPALLGVFRSEAGLGRKS